ncbi:Kelch-like protein 17 [Streptomyces sp. NPDC087263]|uniref:Kelch repeat-containing protein n=1 Tax=Streptomyces sp. NPDC087263 TaxID=3365773 RepID=UPI00380182BE
MTSPTLAATGAWTKAGDLPAAASWYGQHDGPVLLKNNKVLLVGGSDAASAATNKTALFDQTGTTPKWTAGPRMQSPRRLHTVTLLADGKVLVTGGTSGSSPTSAGLTSVELYTPSDTGGSWKTVTSLREGRYGHSAVLLADNKRVLVTGGTTVRSGDSVRALASAEIYDVAAGTWTGAAPMTDARSGHSAVVLKGGQVLVAGGTAPVSPTGGTSLAFCELYTPNDTTGTWTPTGSLLQPRSGHQTVFASDTTALVIGGATPGLAGDGTFDPYRGLTGERFELGAGKWAPLPAVGPPLTPGGRAQHRVVALGSGQFLVIGGTADDRDGAGYQSALIYDESAKSWSAATGPTDGRWAFGALALAAGKVLVTGGTLAAGIAAADPDSAELAATTEVFTLGGTP